MRGSLHACHHMLAVYQYAVFSNFSQTRLAVVSAVLPHQPDSEWDFHFDKIRGLNIGFNSCIQIVEMLNRIYTCIEFDYFQSHLTLLCK
jgi:hypothetical protein